ncbi:hypothetical protein CFE53_00765 [Methanofervidicoccus sp. A16]|uniref:DUF366 family protein n=1 Tax=Methanofervidicoccus sp. A16 TaxID=2607662 RepID=UPI00118A86B0|nr:DUF366 family protein [Methanofervidicoccus sp. A16]AXI24773.1 hypothetical protein CFE53_00765 [Methanofervidicoccus sp. A16]
MKIIHFNTVSLIIEEKRMTYTGKELEPLWAFERYSIQKDSIVVFRGKIEVPLENMKDLKDVKEEGFRSKVLITSLDAINFILEHFDNPDLKMAYLRQRLLVLITKEVLEEISGKKITRKGDDLYYKGGKLSVSIASRGISSGKIHLGINLSKKGTPSYIKTSSLEDLGIDIEEDTILGIMETIGRRYGEEMDKIEEDIRKTRCLYGSY